MYKGIGRTSEIFVMNGESFENLRLEIQTCIGNIGGKLQGLSDDPLP